MIQYEPSKINNINYKIKLLHTAERNEYIIYTLLCQPRHRLSKKYFLDKGERRTILFRKIMYIFLYIILYRNPDNISKYYNVQMKNEDNYIELSFKEKDNIKVDYELVIATEVKFKIESDDNELIISNTSNNNKKRITKEEMQEYLGKIKNKKNNR